VPASQSVQVQSADFDIAAEMAALQHNTPEAGAMVSFVGKVRDMNDNAPVSDLYIEHYPGMTERSIEHIVAQAKQRWTLSAVRVIHRHGALCANDRIVFVGVSSAHRGTAFQACEYIIDFLKTQAPFWKKEMCDRQGRWVEARASDQTAVRRWEETGS